MVIERSSAAMGQSVGRVLCTRLTCKPEWCDRIKPSNLLLDQVEANVDRFVGFLESGGVPRAQGIPTQSHISPSILVYEDQIKLSNVLLNQVEGSVGRP